MANGVKIQPMQQCQYIEENQEFEIQNELQQVPLTTHVPIHSSYN